MSVVSIIIPCFNAARWIGEAIESCLAQTYRPIEIIVVDDGSTDDSVKIVKEFGDKVILETSSANRGGNHARNRGFELSSGAYIQYLDADDYILPEKIEHQVDALEKSGADVVYGDWRHQHHLPDGQFVMEAINITGHQQDVLESLLSGWWVPSNSLLYRRQAVEASSGWDESLTAAQDKDFFIAVALCGAKIIYFPGCYSIYRRFGEVSVSTGNIEKWLDNHYRVLQKVEKQLRRKGLDERYLRALAKGYFSIGRNYFDRDKSIYLACIKKVKELDPDFTPGESCLYNLAQKAFGFYIADFLASAKRRISQRQF
ncbi:MAG: glycosyltransferase [Desulforudis sp.]|jgi:glycosyltransferase involved in cell wall biosynthesis|nr:MAG: glycosyltransferase [Desulforudis sp.]